MKKSKTLLLAAIIGTIFFFFTMSNINDLMISSMGRSMSYKFGTLMSFAITLPSFIASGFATIFAWIGFGTNKKGFALASGILYAIAIVFMISWFIAYIIQMIFAFIAYGTMGKEKNG